MCMYMCMCMWSSSTRTTGTASTRGSSPERQARDEERVTGRRIRTARSCVDSVKYAVAQRGRSDDVRSYVWYMSGASRTSQHATSIEASIPSKRSRPSFIHLFKLIHRTVYAPHCVATRCMYYKYHVLIFICCTVPTQRSGYSYGLPLRCT